MKTLNILALFLVFPIATFLTSCNNDDETNDVTTAISIMSPADEDMFNSEDDVHVHVNFNREDASEIHHVSVVISNMTTGETVFDMPTDYHVSDADGNYDLHGDLILPVLTEHNHYKLTATTWGHEDGANVVESSIEFHGMP